MSKARSMARRFAVQALYTWELSNNDLSDIETQFLMEQDMKKADKKYFKELLHKIPAKVDDLDEQITKLLDRPMKEVDPVERAIMRLGIYELKYRPDVPYKVIINESVELAKTFGAEEGFKYVNSILDGAARTLRAIEIKARQSS